MYCITQPSAYHDNVIKWKHFPRNWPFVRRIHRSPVNSPHKGQWRGVLMHSFICARINGWVNNREAGDSRRHRAHDVIAIFCETFMYYMNSTVKSNIPVNRAAQIRYRPYVCSICVVWAMLWHIMAFLPGCHKGTTWESSLYTCVEISNIRVRISNQHFLFLAFCQLGRNSKGCWIVNIIGQCITNPKWWNTRLWRQCVVDIYIFKMCFLSTQFCKYLFNIPKGEIINEVTIITHANFHCNITSKYTFVRFIKQNFKQIMIHVHSVSRNISKLTIASLHYTSAFISIELQNWTLKAYIYPIFRCADEAP